jgi:hypothetical protein
MGSAVGTLAGAALGSFVPGVGTALGATLGGAAGGLFGGGSPNVSGAYNTASNAMNQASQNANFTPVGITTNFGSSQFGVNPQTGQLTSAGYTLSPELQALQESLLGGYGGALQQAQGVNTGALQQGANTLYNLGQSYLGQSPAEVQQNYIKQQQALLAPGQEQTLANIRNKLFQTGRSGLATGGTVAGGMQATNPELAAYYNSLAQQNAQIAANANQAAQNQITFGQGLLSGGAGLQSTGYGLQSAAYSPLQTQLGLGSTIESMGQQPFGLSSQLAGLESSVAGTVGQLASQAAQTGLAGQIAQQGINATQQTNLQNQLTGLLSNQQVQQGLGSVGGWFNNLITPSFDTSYNVDYNYSPFNDGSGYQFDY